jgi:hypothetical protein
MTLYNVHIYREMLLKYEGIEAATPEQAAEIAGDKPTDDADEIEDCEGYTSTALVDVVGDEEYEQSRWIDFEFERLRNAAPLMLEALQAFIEADELAGQCHEWKWESLEHAFKLARTAIAQAAGRAT